MRMTTKYDKILKLIKVINNEDEWHYLIHGGEANEWLRRCKTNKLNYCRGCESMKYLDGWHFDHCWYCRNHWDFNPRSIRTLAIYDYWAKWPCTQWVGRVPPRAWL